MPRSSPRSRRRSHWPRQGSGRRRRAGATVTVTAVATNRQRVVVSNGDGVYTAASLAPGAYRIDVELPGFKPVRREGIHLATGEKARIDFDLAVGDVREQVTVTGDAPIAARRDRQPRGGRRARAGRAAAAERPHVHHAGGARARRRAAAELAAAAHQRRPAAHERVSVRRHLGAAARAGPGRVLPGHRRDSGIQDREQQPAGRVRPLQRRRRQPHDQSGRATPFTATGSSSSATRRSTRATSFSRPTRSSPSTAATSSAARSAARSSKDRTFFFVDYQGQRQAIGRTVISTVPTLLQRQGIFTEAIGGRVPVIYDPATTVGSARDAVPGQHHSRRTGWIRSPLALLQRYPLPTSARHGEQLSAGPATKSTIRTSGTSRIDHQFAVESRPAVRPPDRISATTSSR